ncbi:MAG: hypothetical protein SGARI_005227 [Bacillariaceae sp.]
MPPTTEPPATSDPGVTPGTDAPTDGDNLGGRTDPPSDAPDGNSGGEPCKSTSGGTFGTVSGTPSTDVPVSYMYEMETAPGVTQMTIDTVILPSLEKAIVDSVLQEAFPDECPSSDVSTEVGKRLLRSLRRRLAVTGITMNPPDMVNEECKKFFLWLSLVHLVCDSTAISDPDNGCSIIDGALTLYTTDGQATEEEDKIQQVIRDNMNSGAYNVVSDDIVRLVYLDTLPNPPESNTGGDGNSGTGGEDGTSGRSNQLRVGLFVGLFGGAAIIAGVLYRTRRNRNVDDETDMQTNNGASAALQPADSQSGIISLEDSGGMLSHSYDESGMVMADTGMDSVSSDGLGIAA